jgi:hypothetical protein
MGGRCSSYLLANVDIDQINRGTTGRAEIDGAKHAKGIHFACFASFMFLACFRIFTG